MKIIRHILLIALLIVVFAGYAGAWGTGERHKMLTSGPHDTNATIKVGIGWFHGIMVTTDAASGVTICVYDSSGVTEGATELIVPWYVTTSATDRAQAFSVNPPINFANGLIVDITISGATYMVYYE